MSTEPPAINYLDGEGAEAGRTEAETSSDRSSPYAEIANKIQLGLTWGILILLLLFWAIVGAIFWIPLIIRALLRFSISHLEASFEGKRPTEAGEVLRNAVGFYRRGFVVAIEAVTKEEIEKAPDGPMMENRLLLEVLWALLVWYFIFLFFGWIQASPLDLWDWLTSIPWGEYFSDLISRFRS